MTTAISWQSGVVLASALLLAALTSCGSDGSVSSQRQLPTATAVPVLSEAEFELVNTQEWLNSAPMSIGDLTDQGRVVLVDFWTYTCVNCINTFPALRAWHERYAEHGLTVIGVHTPEFKFEREFSNLSEAVLEHDLPYPIVQDNEYATWRAFGNRYWPATYLIDSAGRLRHTHFISRLAGTRSSRLIRRSSSPRFAAWVSGAEPR